MKVPDVKARLYGKLRNVFCMITFEIFSNFEEIRQFSRKTTTREKCDDKAKRYKSGVCFSTVCIS